MEIDTLIKPRWIIPVEPHGVCLTDHALAIDEGKILEILPTDQADAKYQPDQLIERPNHALLPGFINAHTHAPMSLLRGLADDLPLMEWLNEHIWPAEGRWVSSEFVQDGTQLAVAEMIASGTTCFQDMYFFPEVVARQASQLGMRACIGLITIDFPSAWANSSDEYIAKGLELHDQLQHDPLMTTAFAPHAPYTVSDDSLRRIRVMRDELEIPIHMHVHETAFEVEQAQKELGQRPLQRLSDLDLLSPGFNAVHMTQLTDDEIALLVDANANVIHCPESNLKLASGFCPVQRLIEAGVNVALGTDGAASNNDLDMFSEMRTAALLGKGVSGDAAAIPAETALRMATLNGATALGMADQIGSLVAGKNADMIAVDLSALHSQPLFNPISQLVYTAGRDQVTDTWIAGRHLYSNRQFLNLDLEQIREKTSIWGERISKSDHKDHS